MNTEKPGRLRVVLDSNVYISAFTHPQGPPFRIWQQALSRRYALLISPAILTEVAGVLRLDFAWEELRLIRRIKLLSKTAEVIRPQSALQVIADDPSDDRILECAVSGQAALIVSGDHHLRDLKTYRGIAIIRPIDFLRTLGDR